MYEYIFVLPATYVYRITADSEEEAREKLVEDGGIGILGDAYPPEYKDYLNAHLEDINELEEQNY